MSSSMLEVSDIASAAEPRRPKLANVTTIGYQGRTVDELIAELRATGANIVVDVRLSPISRKPGLSKTRLAATLEASGIEYLHLRGLGNPRDNRAGFAGEDRLSRNRFAKLLRQGEGYRDLQILKSIAASSKVALLCFEEDERHCHRAIIKEALVS